jgi:SAM-dependent methyltransferase
VYEKRGYPILACSNCGAGQTQVGTRFDPSGSYGQAYFEGEQPDGYASYAGSEPVLRAEFRKVLAELRRWVPRGGRILEVGCAYGFFLIEAARYYQCVGIDVSEQAVAFARGRGADARCGALDDRFARDSGRFDGIVMLDVIEHLPDPAAVLRRAHGLLNAGGHLLMTTGDWESPLARLTGRHWRLMTPPQHLFFFSRRSLTKLLENVGFQVVHVQRPWKLVPLGLALYQMTRRFGLRAFKIHFLNRLGFPVNLFDVIQLVAQKAPSPRESAPRQ